MEPQQNQNPMGSNVPSYPSTPPTEESKKVGPVVAILVVVLILVIAALYLFASRVNDNTLPVTDTISGDATLAPDSSGIITDTSDDLDALQRDLDAAIPVVE